MSSFCFRVSIAAIVCLIVTASFTDWPARSDAPVGKDPASLFVPQPVSLVSTTIDRPSTGQTSEIDLTAPQHSGHQDHEHDHGAHSTGAQDIEPPQVFLDKSPRVVAFQLKRLDNQRLLLVERGMDDVKYLPVHEAILTRDGMSGQHREDALEAIVTINESDEVAELFRIVDTLASGGDDLARVANQLIGLIVRQPAALLQAHESALAEAASSTKAYSRLAGMAGLLAADRQALAWETAQGNQDAIVALVDSISFLPQASMRSEMRPMVMTLIGEDQVTAIRRSAIAALANIPADQDDTFVRIGPFVEQDDVRDEVVQTMLRIPREQRDSTISQEVVTFLVALIEQTPAENRTDANFVDAMQLADQLMGVVPVDVARPLRARLREVTVRVVRIRSVEEEMRFDIPYFAVEAGRPVQIVLQNDDLMPHNLVVTEHGALQEVAELALQSGPVGGRDGKQYVPDVSQVLFATHMVQAGQQERLTFTAPTEPGEYPYVCTFPRHWMRMYGVMVVVEDLDAWLKDPVAPEDPVGNARSFVNSWTVEELAENLDNNLRGRSRSLGQKIFEDASCAQCHKMEGQGGSVGPDLAGLMERWEGDRYGVLREVIEPSHKIDTQYTVHVVVTLDGEVFSGIIQSQNDESVTLIANPEDPQPVVLLRDDIDEMVQSDKSLMPKALLDWFTADEIYELMAYMMEASDG